MMQVFQSRKDRKAREEDLARQMDEIRRAVSWIADSSESAEATIHEMEKGSQGLEDSLHQAVSLIQGIRQGEAARTEAEELLRHQLILLSHILQQQEESCGHGQELARERQGALREAAEKNGSLLEPVQSLGQRAGSLKECFGQLQQGASALLERGRAMGALSLNAAIEAGRMGEPGRKFVFAVEDVRCCAEECRQMAEQAVRLLLGLEGELSGITEQLARLGDMVQEQGRELDRLCQEAEGCLGQMDGGQPTGAADGGHPAKLASEQLMEIGKAWEQAADSAAEHEEHCRQALQHMEAAGARHTQGCQGLERLGSQVEQIRATIKERKTWG